MTAMDSDPVVARERVSSYLYFGSLYFISVGILYLWGYWSSFEINILEYISLADVLKLTAFPIASAFAAFALGVVMGEVLTARIPQGAGRDTAAGRFMQRAAPFLIFLYASVTTAIFLFGPISKWYVLPILIAFPIYFAAKDRGLLRSLLPDDSSRSVTIFLLATLPFWAYGNGRLKAAAVLDGTHYRYLVADTVEGLSVKDSKNITARVKYVGHAGDHEFFLLPDNETLAIVHSDKARGLHLRVARRTGEPQAPSANAPDSKR